MYDVVIIGCGITGAAAAFELSKYQLKIAVLEKENDVAEGSTKANSAILHAGYDPEPGTLMAKLNVRGTQLGKELCRQLDVPCKQIGSFVIGFDETDEKELQNLYNKGKANGVPDLQLLSGEEARVMEPHLSKEVTGALYAPSAAIVSPWEYCLALAETAVRNGAELYLEREVTGIVPIDGGWRVETQDGAFETRWVVNAAGQNAGRVHDMAAPHTFDIHPGRGEYYLLDKEEGDRVTRTIFQCPGPKGKGVLVSPTVHGNLIVGPNSEPVDSTATTTDALNYVREMASRSVPSVNYRASIRNFAGVRATSDSKDFMIGEAAPGFFDLAGICSPGLSSAPAIAEYAVEHMGVAGLELRKKDHFICQRKRVRFKELPESEKAALVQKTPAYGRIVCRCETVSEGEILDALHTPIPPRSVDGVKRRVNAGMGRCQGGFCGPRVVELLSRELGVPPTEIIQDRAGTWLLSGETKTGKEI